MDFRILTIESQQQGVTAFIAVVLFQMLFVFVQWGLHRRIDYLYYLIYLFTVILYSISLYRDVLYIAQYFPLGEWLLKINLYSLSLFSVFFYFRFQRSFLELPLHHPELNVLVKRLEKFLLFYCIIAPLLVVLHVDDTILFSFFLAMVSFTILASVYIVSKFIKTKIPLEQFSIIGAVFIIIGSLLTVALSLQGQQSVYISVNPHLPLLLCVLAELFTFTTGLTYKSYLIEKAKAKSEQDLLIAEQERQRVEIQFLKMRNDISKNLHDELGSSLSLARLLIKQVNTNNLNGSNKFVDNSVVMIDEAIASLYQIIKNLKDDSVKPYNCVEAINQMIAMLKPINSVAIQFQHNIKENELPVFINEQLSRIILELINNTLKHANASKILIEIFKNDEIINGKYVDDGEGVNMEKCNLGNGLKNIAERVNDFEGTLQYLSTEGKGFSVSIEFDHDIKLKKVKTA